MHRWCWWVGIVLSSVAVGQQWVVEEPWRLRPPLVLVLSGGGARGIAQLGVLQVLEDAGFAPDAVVGTSIGAVLGGLYAAGYTPQELEELVMRTDWKELLALERSERADLFVDQRWEEDRKVLTLFFEKFRPVLPLALSSGNRMASFLQALVWRAPYVSGDFDSLRCRFRAVATDLVHGRAVVLRSGDLAHALRASSTFPLRYTPVRWDSLLLVDGGLEANLPVRIARREFPGAIVVAVNTTAPLRAAAELTTPWAVADQSISLLMRQFVEADRAAADVLIEPEIGQHGTLEFDRFEQLLAAGREAARRALPQVRSRYALFWDSLAAEFLQRVPGGYALPVEELRLIGWMPQEEHALRRLQGTAVGRVVAEALRLGAEGKYQRLRIEVIPNGSGATLVCCGEPYRRYARLEVWGIPEPLADVLGRSVTDGELLSASPVCRQRLLYALVRQLSSYGVELVRCAGWQEADSCLQVWLRQDTLESIDCLGLEPQECAELRELLGIEGVRIPRWEDFWQRWQKLERSGLMRAVEARCEQEAEHLRLRLYAERKPAQQLHIGIRVDNERYTRLWIEALHRQGIARQWGIRLSGAVGPRDLLAACELSLQRAFPEVWAAIRVRLFAESRLVRRFSESPTASGWDVLQLGDLRRQRYGVQASMSFPFQPVDVLEGWVRYERQREVPLEAVAPFSPLLLWGVGFFHDNRDRAEFPQRGQLLRLLLEGSLIRLPEGSGFTRAELLYERALLLGRGHSVWWRLHFGAADAALPAAEFFALGGLQSFLGMREEQLRGRQLVCASVLYLLPIPPLFGLSSHLFARVDVGRVWDVVERIQLSALRQSLGGGLLLETPLGLAAVALGRSVQLAQTPPFLRWGPTVLSLSIGSSMP